MIFQKFRHSSQPGMTLMEIIIVVIILGILAGISMRSIQRIDSNARFNETIDEMNILAEAIVGNPSVIQNDIRIDFGYVGDTGVMPPTIEDLFSNVSSVSGWEGSPTSRGPRSPSLALLGEPSTGGGCGTLTTSTGACDSGPRRPASHRPAPTAISSTAATARLLNA